MVTNLWDHQNKAWRETLALAREYGWTIREATNHGGKIVTCPSPDPDARHRIRVFSTAVGTESVAKRERRTIERCEHREVSDRLVEAEGMLAKADRFLCAARALLDRGDAQAEMIEILSFAEDQIACAQAAYDEAEERSDLAQAAVEAVSLGSDEPSDPDGLLSGAGSNIRTADQVVRTLPEANERVGLAKARILDLRARHSELQRRLAERSA